MKHYIDNSIAPIIAIDFDGTISIGNGYPDPHNGDIRPYAKEVINFLYDVGVKIVIWTNRKNIPHTEVKDKLLMKQWLDDMGIKYHTVNDSTHFAPFKYYGRKLYATMFVDDRGFGWKETPTIMLDVLKEILVDICGVSGVVSNNIVNAIRYDIEPNANDINTVKYCIATYKNWQEYEDEHGKYHKMKVRVSGTDEYKTVLIDSDDYDKFSTGNKWIINKYGYIIRKYRCSNGKYDAHYLHRDIMDNPINMTVDHIDGDTFNCRKYNLRVCTQSDNSKNQKLMNTNTSGVKGVCYDSSRNKWKAEICVNYKKIMLGRFENKDDAIKARHDAEIKYFGEYNRK